MRAVWTNQCIYGLEDSRFLRVKISVLTKFICRFSTISIKNPAGIFTKIGKLILKHIKRQRTKKSQNGVEKQRGGKNGGFIPPDFKVIIKLQWQLALVCG